MASSSIELPQHGIDMQPREELDLGIHDVVRAKLCPGGKQFVVPTLIEGEYVKIYKVPTLNGGPTLQNVHEITEPISLAEHEQQRIQVDNGYIYVQHNETAEMLRVWDARNGMEKAVQEIQEQGFVSLDDYEIVANDYVHDDDKEIGDLEPTNSTLTYFSFDPNPGTNEPFTMTDELELDHTVEHFISGAGPSHKCMALLSDEGDLFTVINKECQKLGQSIGIHPTLVMNDRWLAVSSCEGDAIVYDREDGYHEKTRFYVRENDRHMDTEVLRLLSGNVMICAGGERKPMFCFSTLKLSDLTATQYQYW